MPDLPIKSYHCTTTHSACDCVLERLKKLEKVVEAAKGCSTWFELDESDGDAFYKLNLALKELELKYD